MAYTENHSVRLSVSFSSVFSRRLISENPSRSPKVEVSIVEVYNNDIFDLLAKDTVAAVSGVKREVMTAKDGRTEVALLASE